MSEATALVMAGGRGSRMRASGLEMPKPLVIVAGQTLLERNVRSLLLHGFADIIIAVPSGPDGDSIARCVSDTIEPLCRPSAARVSTLVESEPMGNIGCAGLVDVSHGCLLVVFADNLTALDLGALMADHRQSRGALTLAAHYEAFRLPYGRLRLSDAAAVTAYEEKPLERALISSGAAVLDPAARQLIPRDRPTGLSDLFRLVSTAALGVHAHLHDAPWIDVNDKSALQRASDRLREDPNAFTSPLR